MIECTAGVPAGCSGARGVSCGTEGGGTSWDGSCFTTGDCTEGVAGVDGVEGGSVGSEGAIGEGTVGFVGVTWAVAAGVAGEVPGPVSCGIFLVLFCLFFFFTCLVFLARLFCVFFAPFFGCTLFLFRLAELLSSVVLCCADSALSIKMGTEEALGREVEGVAGIRFVLSSGVTAWLFSASDCLYLAMAMLRASSSVPGTVVASEAAGLLSPSVDDFFPPPTQQTRDTRSQTQTKSSTNNVLCFLFPHG